MSFLPFILNTAQQLTNDPKNSYFLPKLLEPLPGNNAQGRLLPIEQESWVIGPIHGVPGNTITTAFENNWLTYLEKVEKVNLAGKIAIADSQTPQPVLTLGHDPKNPIKIIGLENVKVTKVQVLGSTDSGYHSTLTLQMDQWTLANSGVDYPQLSISTPYTMRQNLCLTNQGQSICGGQYSTQIDGNGTVDVQIQHAHLEVDVSLGIVGQGTTRKIGAILNSLKLHGSNPTQSPQLNISKLTIGANVSQFLLNVWENAARQAILSPDGSSGIFQQVDAALNSQNNLQTISSMVGEQLGSILDRMLGTVPNGQLPNRPQAPGVNPVDQYLMDRASYALNALSNSWYLPKVLCSIDNPRLDPLNLSTINLPNISILGLEATQVTLSQVQVIGISNALTPSAQMQFQPSCLNFVATLGLLNPPPVLPGQRMQIPPPPTFMRGQFSLNVMDTPLNGGIIITLAQPTLSVNVNSEGETLADLQLIVNQLQVGLSNLNQLLINVQIESEFTEIINGALNTDSIKQQILDAVNGNLQDNLQVISHAVTNEAKSILQSHLG